MNMMTVPFHGDSLYVVNQKRCTPGFLIFHEMGAISREAACPVRWWKKPDKTTALCKYRSNMVLLCEI
ncbi:TPA: hypothetical protein PBQ97_004910 [Escherichia coli]|nr:hypothetical protein [Escherichia coli]